LENTKIKKIIESLIFSSTSPISLKELKNFFSEESISIKIDRANNQ
jgi:chromosome segregation and condensation protein ScpB